jgi:hypothetical protein
MIIIEFKYISTCFVCSFDSIKKSTYLVWTLLQFLWLPKWYANSIGEKFFVNDISFRPKPGLKNSRAGPGRGWSKVNSGRAGLKKSWATKKWPVSSPGRLVYHTARRARASALLRFSRAGITVFGLEVSSWKMVKIIIWAVKKMTRSVYRGVGMVRKTGLRTFAWGSWAKNPEKESVSSTFWHFL